MALLDTSEGVTTVNDRKLGLRDLAVLVRVVFAFAAPFVFLGSGAAANPSKPTGKIVFTVSTNSQGDLYTFAFRGSQRRQLTNDRAWEQYPVWSPDGRSIAYVKGGLYRIPATGGQPRLLLRKSSFAQAAIAEIADLSWSPEGRASRSLQRRSS